MDSTRARQRRPHRDPLGQGARHAPSSTRSPLSGATRLPRVASPLRNRPADLGRDLGRARRLRTLLLLIRRRPPQWPRRHRPLLRQPTRPRPPCPPRPWRLALGLFEAAVCAARPASPDHAYYLQVKARLGHQRAVLSVARKLTRWCHHTLRALGDQALAPA